ncbi:SDR family oxidoreductase [Haloarchaeobius sp. HRN-SO-5]|uniref:SDR family oxidoreductase n=1 Tax=Haloarchaeobius sp. HRN-SO-5 TaxID=3446118 RepID=UPI003EC05613
MTEQPLDDRVAIVTGASSGVGSATARSLASDGADVVLAARREERLEELATEIRRDENVQALPVSTDVRDPAQVEALVDAAVEELGGLDVLVNNAGLLRGSDVESMTDDEFRTMQATNVDGVFYATRAALPHLRESAGHLIYVGSFAGQYPRPFNPVYAATKWWVRGFALSVAAQVGGDDVAVTVVNPSEVRTEFGPEGGEPFKEQYDEGDVTEPVEVAEAIAFAAGREGSTVSELDLYRRDKLTMF